MEGDTPLDFVQVILHSAALFGLLGFLFGPVIGTIVGSIIGGYFRAALWNPFDYHPPTWVGVLMVVGIVAGGWWWLAR